MKILVDEDIVYVTKLFSTLGDVIAIPGRSISKEKLHNIDAIILRSVTIVNKELLQDTPVKFVGTATSGTDHIDHTWLQQSGITFASTPGCNAISVVEYVFSALLMLAERDNFLLSDRTIGIIGVGNIGQCLQKRLKLLGVRTLLCDPPRADKYGGNFHSISELIEQADVLTFHIPLLKDGPYKTLYLVDQTLLNRLRPGCILINTSRGSIIDNTMLLTCLERGQNFSVVLDVWESEPNINLDLLKKVDIATAHIAGHTLEGRIRSTIRLFEIYSRFIKNPKQAFINALLPSPTFDCINLHGNFNEKVLKHLVHTVYHVKRDDIALRKTANTPGAFDTLRKNYFLRREWSSMNIRCEKAETASFLCQLGFHAIHYPTL